MTTWTTNPRLSTTANGVILPNSATTDPAAGSLLTNTVTAGGVTTFKNGVWEHAGTSVNANEGVTRFDLPIPNTSLIMGRWEFVVGGPPVGADARFFEIGTTAGFGLRLAHQLIDNKLIYFNASGTAITVLDNLAPGKYSVEAGIQPGTATVAPFDGKVRINVYPSSTSTTPLAGATASGPGVTGFTYGSDQASARAAATITYLRGGRLNSAAGSSYTISTAGVQAKDTALTPIAPLPGPTGTIAASATGTVVPGTNVVLTTTGTGTLSQAAGAVAVVVDSAAGSTTIRAPYTNAGTTLTFAYGGSTVSIVVAKSSKRLVVTGGLNPVEVPLAHLPVVALPNGNADLQNLGVAEDSSWYWSASVTWTGDLLAEYQVEPVLAGGVVPVAGLEVIVKGNRFVSPHLVPGTHQWRVRKRLSTTTVTNTDGTTQNVYTYGDWVTTPVFVCRDWPAPVDGKVRWPIPPDFNEATATVRTIAANATSITLSTAGDYILQFPSTPIQLPSNRNGFEIIISTTIPAGQRVRYIVRGGQVNPYSPHTTAASKTGIKVTAMGLCETFGYWEGFRTGPGGYGDGFEFDHRNAKAILIMQNIAVGVVHGFQSGEHADIVQFWGGIDTFLVDRMSGVSTYQQSLLHPFQFGTRLGSEPGWFGRWVIENWDGQMAGRWITGTPTADLGASSTTMYSFHHATTKYPLIDYPTGDRGIYERLAQLDSSIPELKPSNVLNRGISYNVPTTGIHNQPGIWNRTNRNVIPPGGTVLIGNPGPSYVSPGSSPVPARTTTAPTVPTPVPVTAPLSIGGTGGKRNWIMRGNERWVAKGAVLYWFPYNNAGSFAFWDSMYNSRVAILDKMKSIGLNSVRLAVSSSATMHTYHDTAATKTAAGGLAIYLNKIAEWVRLANERGMVVSLCDWTSMTDTDPTTGVKNWVQNWQAGTRYQPFHTALMQKIGTSNPNVIFEPFNEPGENTPTTAEWYSVMREVLTFYRTTLGYKGLLQIDTPGWSWSFPKTEIDGLIALDATLTGTGLSNMAIANHRYGNAYTTFSATAQAELDSQKTNVATYPIIGTEHGFFNGAAQANSIDWVKGFFAYVAQTMVPAGHNGIIGAFSWSWVDNNNMTDADRVTLNVNGNAFVTEYVNKLPA